MGSEIQACKKIPNYYQFQQKYHQKLEGGTLADRLRDKKRQVNCNIHFCEDNNKDKKIQINDYGKSMMNGDGNSKEISRSLSFASSKLSKGGRSKVELRKMADKKNQVDGSMIKRRESLAKMLVQKLQLNIENVDDLPLVSHSEEEEVERNRLIQMVQVIYNICINDQDHLIDVIDQLETEDRARRKTFQSKKRINIKLQSFLSQVRRSQLDLLDMVFHNPTQQSKNIYNRQITQHIIDVKQAIMQQTQFQQSATKKYEHIKSKGLQLIKNGKVCFFVLAGGKSSRFLISREKVNGQMGSTQGVKRQQQERSDAFPESKDFCPLDIPSGRSIIQLIIHRFIALSQLLECKITFYLAINPDKTEDLKRLFSRIKVDDKKMCIYPFQQKTMGALDLQGKLVLEDYRKVSLWPVGTGDLWDILSGSDKNLGFPTTNDLIQKGFQYLQVLGIANVLEKCFDCYALGLAEQADLDWTTKVVESYQRKHQLRSSKHVGLLYEVGVQTKIYINQRQQIYVCDPQQSDNYPDNCELTFINSSIFKLTYLRQVFKSSLWPQLRLLRKKTHLCNNVTPFSRHRRVVSFEKDYTDIFTSAARFAYVSKQAKPQPALSISTASPLDFQPTRYKIIKCQKQDDYYPLIYKHHHHSDIQCASLAISELHKSYLGIMRKDNQSKCQIDPYVSLDGENLEDIKEQIRNNNEGEEEEELESLYITNHTAE